MFMNIQAFNYHELAVKQLLMDDSGSSPLVLALSEAQINGNESSTLNVMNYQHIYLPAASTSSTSRKGGGTIIYFKAIVQWKYLPHLSLSRITALPDDAEYGRTSSVHTFEMKLPNLPQSIILCITYLAPSTNKHTSAIQALHSCLDLIADEYDHQPVIILGDFNQRSNIWDSRVTPRMAQSTQYHHAGLFYDYFHDHDYILLNTSFQSTKHVCTRPSSSSVLDLCFVNQPAHDLVENFVIGRVSLADHLSLSIDLKRLVNNQHNVKPDVMIWDLHNPNKNWRDELPAAVNSHLTNNQQLLTAANQLNDEPASQADAQLIIQSIWDSFHSAINQSMLDTIGQVSKKAHSYHWFDHNCKKAHLAVTAARKIWRKARNTVHEAAYHTKYRLAQHDFKQTAIKSKVQSMQNMYASILPTTQSPLLWSCLARLKNSKAAKAIGSIVNEDGELPDSPQSSLDNLCSQFVESSQPIRSINQSKSRQLREFVNEITTKPIDECPHESNEWTWSSDEVEQQCKYQRNHKSAPGPDQIPPIILRHLPSSCYQLLTNIFNYSYKHSVLPSQWTCANVFSLVKDPSKPLNDSSNYRPIAVTSIWIRTYEHLLHKKLTELIDPAITDNSTPSKLYHHQYGFRRGRSCQQAIHLLLSVIKDAHRASQSGVTLPTPAIFIDLAKAFDRVSHRYLIWYMYKHFGLSGRALRWIHRWISHNRRIRCAANGFYSNWHSLREYGVIQGAVLSPLLFLLFINHIAIKISITCPLIITPLFADDIAVMAKTAKEFHAWWYSEASKNERSHIEAEYGELVTQQVTRKKSALTFYRDICIALQTQRALSLFTRWLTKTGMNANPSKSKVVVFTSCRTSHMTWYNQSYSHWFQQLKLDGFVLQLTDKYDYLGITLDHQLSWQTHLTKITQRAASASNLLIRLFRSNQHMPHPLAAIKLVRALVIPVITYAIEQWFDYSPSQSTSQDAIDKLHSIILRPLRSAFKLPTTTHRLGLLVDCGIPTLHDIARQSIIRFYDTYANASLHSHQNITQSINDNTLHNGQPIDQLHPTVTRLILDAHFSQSIKPNTITAQQKWTSIGARARFIVIPSVDQLIEEAKTITQLQSINLITSYIPKAYNNQNNNQNTQLNQAPPWSINEINEITHLSTFIQWKHQWKSENPDHQRATTAPLTLIKQIPHTAPFIHCIDDKKVIQILMRLRHGRAFTHDVRARFPSTAIQNDHPNPPPITDLCKHHLCEQNHITDSVQHLLLDCPRHETIRNQLVQSWKQHRYGRSIISPTSLRLHMMLGEAPGTFTHQWKNKYIQWYRPLVTFINSLYNNLPTSDQYPVPL